MKLPLQQIPSWINVICRLSTRLSSHAREWRRSYEVQHFGVLLAENQRLKRQLKEAQDDLRGALALSAHYSGWMTFSGSTTSARDVYLTLARKYHPDRHLGSDEIMKDINQLYQAVRQDNNKRALQHNEVMKIIGELCQLLH